MAEEVALPALLQAVALLHLDDDAAPVGHAVGNVDVLDDAGLQAVAELEHRRLADRCVDVVFVERVRAQAVDDTLGVFAHGDSGDVEGRRLIGLAHVAGPFGVEMVLALGLVGLGLRRLEAAVARIDIAFDHDLRSAIAQASTVRAFTTRTGKPCAAPATPNLVAAIGQDHIVECARPRAACRPAARRSRTSAAPSRACDKLRSSPATYGEPGEIWNVPTLPQRKFMRL